MYRRGLELRILRASSWAARAAGLVYERDLAVARLLTSVAETPNRQPGGIPHNFSPSSAFAENPRSQDCGGAGDTGARRDVHGIEGGAQKGRNRGEQQEEGQVGDDQEQGEDDAMAKLVPMSNYKLDVKLTGGENYQEWNARIMTQFIATDMNKIVLGDEKKTDRPLSQ
ncbi:hypothetical protein PC129_g13899 [Phytophthora cactorum]|uniref:Uncharacterized protein n=2 Tax=Phytophthora cactorum TaxID=29920 RepID=A0A329RPI0_9STRA|nr:hypothetical protein PC111_g15203 [Phytophthora cactorum]KAG2837068.1 hypothetical protein PC112_g5069 [Phytophthora cactorum]KAG2906876.1 hypothetical protein PC115_g14124 [Phytophthora cactorum]KAG2922234.1 hypothetical protein PC114_g5345 [Phytophthora cactorum]KAG3036021.1 hypothetical protein PC119_g4405 [Phytophthora cactorum]